MMSPNVLLQSAQPVVRRQVENALLTDMPHARLFEAADWMAAEALAEEHDLDIVLLSADDMPHGDLTRLAILRRLQPETRIILLTFAPLPSEWASALDVLDVSAVSLRYLAPTLLRPMSQPIMGASSGDWLAWWETRR